jgi:hypothetical protein
LACKAAAGFCLEMKEGHGRGLQLERFNSASIARAL